MLCKKLHGPKKRRKKKIRKEKKTVKHFTRNSILNEKTGGAVTKEKKNKYERWQNIDLMQDKKIILRNCLMSRIMKKIKINLSLEVSSSSLQDNFKCAQTKITPINV